jgi:hypothetical protein
MQAQPSGETRGDAGGRYNAVMDQERMLALCRSHHMKCRLIVAPREASGLMPAGWDTVMVYDGPVDAFDRAAWIDLREAFIAGMAAQGYEPVLWFSMSDDDRHCLAWAPQGTPRFEPDERWPTDPGVLLRAQRLADHQCVACGYGLPATPGRCPECGTVPAVVVPPSA